MAGFLHGGALRSLGGLVVIENDRHVARRCHHVARFSYCCGLPLHNGLLVSDPNTCARTSASPSRAPALFLPERATLDFLPCFFACTAFLAPLCEALLDAVDACCAQMPALIHAAVRRAAASLYCVFI